MKYEWKKHAKEFYMPKEKVDLITILEFKFFMLKGKGNPMIRNFLRQWEFYILFLMQ